MPKIGKGGTRKAPVRKQVKKAKGIQAKIQPETSKPVENGSGAVSASGMESASGLSSQRDGPPTEVDGTPQPLEQGSEAEETAPPLEQPPSDFPPRPSHLPTGWILQTGDGPAARSEYYAVPPSSGERYWLSTRNTARARGRAISQVLPLVNGDPALIAQAYAQLYRAWTQRRTIRAGWVLTDDGPQFHIVP